eukprot:jgi/Psemu1/7413/gm1.7413_g
MIRSRKKLEWLLFNYGWFAVAIFQSRASFSLSFSFLGCSPGTGRRQQQQQQQQHNRRRTTRMASSAAGMGASAPNNRTLSSNNNNIHNNNNNNKNEILEIPIIGPLMNLPKPIVIGDSMWLDPPTPLQWKTIEAAVDAQNGRTLLWNPGSSSPSAAAAASTAMGATTTTAAANKLNLATTDGSPLVAILHNGGHEYATIAAVEGIATTKQQQQQQQPKQQNGYTPSIDTTDAESFRESLARLTLGSPYYSDSSRIRLLAIGRAKLSYHQTKFLNEGFDFAFESNGNNNNNNNENKNEQQPQHGTAPSEPLFVARMELLLDSIHDSGNGNGKYGSSSTSTSTSSTSRNKKASPVHALNRISGVAQRIRFLHDDRQRIARGLRAAQARLEMASDEWEDWDGIGSLDNTNINTNINTLDDNNNNNNNNNNPETTATTTTTTTTDGTSATTTTNPPTPQPIEEDDAVVLGQFLREYDSAIRNNGNSENGEGTGTGRTFPIPMHSMPLSEGAARCTELDNYGLGTTTAAAGSLFVPLSKLAGVLTERLEPYYSPERLSSEEFGYEALSWCVLQSLQAYLTPREIHAALYECTSTCGRLDLLYRAMVRHKSELTELAIAKTTELRNCGEECDLDLFG